MDTVNFRALTRGDFPLLTAWLAEPHVAQTEWGTHEATLDAVEADFGASVDGLEPTDMRIVLEDELPVGLIQSYRIGDYPEAVTDFTAAGISPDAIGIDYLIGKKDATGRGLGPEMIRNYVDVIWRQHHEPPIVTAAVYQDNLPSCRALEKAGFIRVWSGVLASDGTRDQKASHVYEKVRLT